MDEWIKKLPARTREYILEVSRQRDEWQAKYEAVIAKTEEKRSRLRTIYSHWLEASGGNPEKIEFKKTIEPILQIYTDEQILYAIDRYMEDTEPKYISLKRFGEIIGQYIKRHKKPALDPNSDLSIEDQRKNYKG